MNTNPTTPSPEARKLIQGLHDELRADIPDIKIGWKSLKPPPWDKARIDGMAARHDAAVDARVAGLEAEVAGLRGEVEAIVAALQTIVAWDRGMAA